MFIINTKAEKLQTILSLLNKDTISPDQLGKIIATLIGIVKQTKTDNEVISKNTKDALAKALTYFDAENAKVLLLNDVAIDDKVIAIGDETKTKLNSIFTKFLTETKTKAQQILDELRAIELKEAEQGDKGEKGDKGEPGKDGSSDTPEQIAEKLNTLGGAIDWKVIKNAPHPQTIIHEGGHAEGMETPLVDFTSGRPLPKNAQGAYRVQQSSASSVNFTDNEVVAGSATTWNLVAVPIAGSVHLYANGQRLIPTTDYSISGGTITTVLSWDAGTILADYRT